jgi:hypothetical protein
MLVLSHRSRRSINIIEDAPATDDIAATGWVWRARK